MRLCRDHGENEVSVLIEGFCAEYKSWAAFYANLFSKRKGDNHDIPGVTNHGRPRRLVVNPIHQAWKRVPDEMLRQKVLPA